MGYFSNGTEQQIYEDAWCAHCVHHGTEEEGCPVMTLHYLWNYDAVGKGANQDKQAALHLLIPRTPKTGNAKCSMYICRGPYE